MSKRNKLSIKQITKAHQVEITTKKEVLSLLDYDEARWTATSVLIDAIKFDKSFIHYLDLDNNGQVQCYEIKKTIKWLNDYLLEWSGVLSGSDSINLKSISEHDDIGKNIKKSATNILIKLGKEEEQTVSLKQINEIKKVIENNPVSAAGIVLPEAGEKDEMKELIQKIISAVGGHTHPSGKIGINSDEFKEFNKEVDDYLGWVNKTVLTEKQEKSDLLPFENDTKKMYEIFQSIKGKIEQFFSQSRLVAIDPRYLQVTEKSFKEGETQIDMNDIAAVTTFLEKAPLAKPSIDCKLLFANCINELYKNKLQSFIENVVHKIFNSKKTGLNEADWRKIKNIFAKYEAWKNDKKGARVEPLGLEYLQTYQEGSLKKELTELIDKKKTTALDLEEIQLIEKLLLFQKYLLYFINNYVTFPYLYEEDKRAIFELGTLIVDGRKLTLCLKVDDIAKHKERSAISRMYIVYAQIVTNVEEEKFIVSTPVTAGSRENLYIGKPGIFQSIDGKEYRAQIVDILDNPISLVEAVVRPFKRLADTIKSKIDAGSSSSEDKFSSMTVADSTTATTQPAETSGMQVGTLLTSGSIAIAALGSSLAFITSTLARMGFLTILLTLMGTLLAVILPSVISAYIKLRNRDLSPILEASGWAINRTMTLTFNQTRFFTQIPGTILPKRRHILLFVIILAILVAGLLTVGLYTGVIQTFFQDLLELVPEVPVEEAPL